MDMLLLLVQVYLTFETRRLSYMPQLQGFSRKEEGRWIVKFQPQNKGYKHFTRLYQLESEIRTINIRRENSYNDSYLTLTNIF